MDVIVGPADEAPAAITRRDPRITQRQGGIKALMNEVGYILGIGQDADWWLGLWDDTAFVLCTDHGHYLGERNAFGKPPLPIHRC